MKKTYLFLIMLITIIGLTGCSNKNLTSNNSSNSQNIDTTNNQIQTTSQLPIVNNTASLTLTEVTKHNSASDCWMAINGNVYNLSSYIQAGLHPGGDKIINGCGKDASIMFQMMGKHNSGKTGSTLANYLLGALQK